jgi:hypothetical protein
MHARAMLAWYIVLRMWRRRKQWFRLADLSLSSINLDIQQVDSEYSRISKSDSSL